MTTIRRVVQLVFLAITLTAVFGFLANAEAWCPFGGVEAAYTFWREGNMICSLGVANFFLLAAVLAMTLLLRRAFCGYVCPIGAISEWMRAFGKRLRIPQLRVTGWAERAFSTLKYALLALVLFFTWQAGELLLRGFCPAYALIGRHGEDIRLWAYVISGLIVMGSMMISLPFCRWFCPMAAVLNPLSALGLARIKRDENACTGCRRCGKACPTEIPVDVLPQVTSARCISCLSCVEACEKSRRSALVWGPPRRLGRRWSQAVLLGAIAVCLGSAVAGAYWLPFPSFVSSRGEPCENLGRVELQIRNLDCRGRANLFRYFVERDDLHAIPGYVRIEAWPQPGLARVRISFDAAQTDEAQVKRAVTEPYYDAVTRHWRHSPFSVEGYDPLELP